MWCELSHILHGAPKRENLNYEHFKICQISSNWWFKHVTVTLRVKDGIHVVIVTTFGCHSEWQSCLYVYIAQINLQNVGYNGFPHLITATVKWLTSSPSSHWHGNFTSTSSFYTSQSLGNCFCRKQCHKWLCNNMKEMWQMHEHTC